MTTRRVTALPSGTGLAQARLVSIGDYFWTSDVLGLDLGKGTPADTPERQMELAFDALQRLIAEAGARPDDVGLVTVCLSDAAYRPLINPPWLAMFPDERQRPARKTTQFPMPEGVFVQLQVSGARNSTRTALTIPGLSHRDPLPVGVRIGDLVYSSVIGGQDPATNQQIDDPTRQVQQAFANMVTLVEQAGGTKNDVAHVYVFLRDRDDQPLLIQTWLDVFPTDGDRPARKTIFYDELKGRATLVQLQAIAVLGRGRRHNFEVAGFQHHDPIPLGAKLGPLLFSSGIAGRASMDPSLPGSVEQQARLAFDNLLDLLQEAGLTRDDAGLITVMLQEEAHGSVAEREWRRVFPDPENEPARLTMRLGIKGDNLVQLHVVAARS